MRREISPISHLVGVGVLCLGLGSLGTPGQAQEVVDQGLELHQLGSQVGVISKMVGRNVWVTLPHHTTKGAIVEFMAFSDGSHTLATGKVAFVTPTAPFEAYVTDLKATVTKREPFLLLRGLVPAKKIHGPSPVSDGFAISLAVGIYARTPVAPTPEDTDGIEPVQAHITALRALRNPTATAIAEATSVAVHPESVDYQVLTDRLKKFRRLDIQNPFTAKLLKRLWSIAEDSDSKSTVVSPSFLRPPTDPNKQTSGSGSR